MLTFSILLTIMWIVSIIITVYFAIGVDDEQ